MRTKLYYGAIALLFLLSGCNDGFNTVNTNGLLGVSEYIYKGHTYVKKDYGIVHAGHCPQCKHELDSIVKNAVNEAFEASMKEDWNE